MSRKYQPPIWKGESLVDFARYEEFARHAEFVKDQISSFDDRQISAIDVYTTLA